MDCKCWSPTGERAEPEIRKRTLVKTLPGKTELAGFAGSLKRTELAGSAGSLERTAYAHIRLYKTGKRTDREGKGRERTARDKVHREEALGRAWLTFSGSLWSFRERGLGELAMAFSLSLRGKRQSRRGKSGFTCDYFVSLRG